MRRLLTEVNSEGCAPESSIAMMQPEVFRAAGDSPCALAVVPALFQFFVTLLFVTARPSDGMLWWLQLEPS